MSERELQSGDVVKKRLKDIAVQEGLAKIFVHYYDDLQDILSIATVENSGIRPERLANEIYSCFHHIARGLCDESVHAEEEFRTARRSHLKRATLDSYKIAINAFLVEDEKMREILDYLVLVEDFSAFIPDGLAKINEIKASARFVKEHYQIAKASEAGGQFDGAINAFNEALGKCYELREQIEQFTTDKTYLLAVAREAKIQREKGRDRKLTVGVAILSAVLAAVLTALASYYVPKMCDRSKAHAAIVKEESAGKAFD